MFFILFPKFFFKGQALTPPLPLLVATKKNGVFCGFPNVFRFLESKEKNV